MGNDSHVETIKCGVPQGSVLGPLLFIIYTNDLPGCLNLTKSILFADDTTIYLSSNNISYLYTTMNGELLKHTDWFRANKLSLNISKTNYILFTCQNRQVVTNIDLQLSDISIERTTGEARSPPPGSVVPWSPVSRSLMTLQPGPSLFPGGDRALAPPGLIARYWPSRTSTDQPCGKNGNEVSTREHLFTPCPGRPHEKHTITCSASDNWPRPGIPTSGRTDGRLAPASGGTFTSAGLSSWAARNSRAIRKDMISREASWLHPPPPPRWATMSLISHGYRNLWIHLRKLNCLDWIWPE